VADEAVLNKVPKKLNVKRRERKERKEKKRKDRKREM
jgi:hypothetical protein